MFYSYNKYRVCKFLFASFICNFLGDAQSMTYFYGSQFVYLQKSTPCYYERQPGGCTKPNCPFQHKFAGKPRPQPSSKTSTVVTSGMEPLSGTAPPSMPSQTMPSHPPLTG